MGNIQSQVYPELEEDKAPWVMVTYDPGKNYKNFKYDEKFDVYSNDVLAISSLSIEPLPPCNPVQYSVNTNIIHSALQKVHFEDDMTVKELVEALFEQCSKENRQLLDADKVKILFYWMTAQNVKYSEYKLTVDFMTVNYQLQKLRDGKNTYATFFALLSYYANIPCVIIRGHVKGGRYEVDNPLTSDLIREWNAVLVDKEWQFVDTLWGRIYHDRNMTREEWYLFPSPDSLKFSHFPENKTWQLIEHPLTEDEFIQLPVLKKRFFEMNMELLSHTKGRVTCSTGEIEFKFLLNTKDMEMQEFRCVISRQTDGKKWEEERLPEDGLRLQQLDFIQKTRNSDGFDEDYLSDDDDDDDSAGGSGDFALQRMESVVTEDISILTALSVKVRFQTKGYHKIEIVGRQREDEDYDWVAIYHVKVDNVPDWPVFFPIMPNIGFGPNPYLKRCGLKAVSHTSGEIKCFAPTELDVKFKLLPSAENIEVKLRYMLVNYSDKNDNSEESEDYTEEDFLPDEDGTIQLTVPIGSIGEYKLSIAATLNKTDKEYVIHYRIVSEVNQSEILENLAKETLEELKKAIMSEKISDLQSAISSAVSNKVRSHSKVKPKYKEACNLLKTLKKYDRMLRNISEIKNEHIARLKSFNNPDAGIVNIMRVVFLLLGENENTLQSWEQIKGLITGIGRRSIKRRIAGLNVKALKPAVVQRAERQLGTFKIREALRKAEDVAAFALWLDYIFTIHNTSCHEPHAGPSSESQV